MDQQWGPKRAQAAVPPAPPAGVARALLGRVVDVRPDELAGLVWSFLYFFFLLASYYVLRPLRDEMAIIGGIHRLQWLFTGTLAAMLVAVPIWSTLASHLPPRRLIAIVYRFFLANILIFFALFQIPGLQVPIARAFFVWTSVFNLFVVSIFWSLMADVFRQDQGKRLFGFVAAGGSAGAIAGPLVTAIVVGRVGPVNLLLIAALLLESAAQCAGQVAVWATRRITASATAAPGRHGDGDPTMDGRGAAADIAPGPANSPRRDARVTGKAVGGGPWAAFQLLLRSPYLGAIALYVLCMTSTGTLGYMLQAQLVAGADLTSAARTSLFAHIDLAVNIGSAASQALLAGRVLNRFGVGPALLLSPFVTIASVLALAVAPRLGVLIAGQALRRMAEYAVSHPARQILFTVVSREEKYKTKALIDTVVYRSGDAASSWAFTAIAHHGAAVPALALSALPIALVWLAISTWLARQHQRRAAGAA